MTIKEALIKWTHLLTRESSPAAAGELLFAHVLGKSKEWLIAHSEIEVTDSDLQQFVNLAQRYAAGEPMAYLVNNKEFYGLDFYVDQRVLIPRPETEFLVEKTIEFVQKKCSKDNMKILDMGTGSGCIAVALAKRLKLATVFALDVSGDALQVAQMNAKRHQVEDRVEFIESDLLSNFLEQKVDVIVANLPYIGEVKHRYIDDMTMKYEPALALFAGEDGLLMYKKMFQQLQEANLSFYLLVGEFCYGQSADMRELLSKYFDQNFSIEKDLAGIDRYFIVDCS